MQLGAGAKLGPYEILTPIGKGGMGEVYKAHDPRLRRDVAIKVSAARYNERFAREARAVAALNHAHICQVYDVGPNYLVMEYIEGAPLQGPLALDQALRYATQICDALDAAHKKNITHRDLKPGNILVTASGVKLLDFGLAKVAAEKSPDNDTLTMPLTEAGAVMGTPAYMSPEQAKGEEVDARSDIFSFGAVLYEMLSGRRAFARTTSVETMSAILRDEPSPLEGLANVFAIVSRCLRKSPADRFQTMSEVRAELQKAAEPTATKPAGKIPSVAVLPFANMSADKENEYFSDGLAEEVLNLLAKVPGLKVIARTSSFSFRGKEQDIRKIAETLDVSTVLEGSVRRSGNRIRVTAQLIAAADGSHLWSERYDRELADVFAVQDEISAAIAQALQLKLSPQAAAKPRYTPKLPAYEALLKAKHFHWKVSAESMEQARPFYEQAIALDPHFAMAHAGYADYLGGRSVLGMTPARETMPAVRTMAQTALELDASLPEAHALLCWVAGNYDHNWQEAARRFPLIGNAASPWCHLTCGLGYFLALGRRKEAVQELELAVQGDPLHLTHRVILALCLGAVGRYAEAEEHLRQVRDLDPNFFWAYYFFADLYAARQMFVEALPFAAKAHSLAPWYTPGVGIYAGLLVRTGQQDRGREVIQKLGSGASYGASTGLAIYHICCGEIDQAADWFEKAIEERYTLAGAFLQGAIGEPLRASPRWPKLAALMNLPAAGS